MEFILYGYQGRSRADRVLWALRELELPHKMLRLNFLKGENQSPDFLKLNPSGKVPVLVHGKQVLTESMAILSYLNDAEGSHKLIPEGRIEKYIYDHRLHYALTEIEAYLWVADQATALRKFYPWPEGSAEMALKSVNKNIQSAEFWLHENKYICGDFFNAADILYYHLLVWAKSLGQTLSKKTEKYLTLLESRKAFPKIMAGPSQTKQMVGQNEVQ